MRLSSSRLSWDRLELRRVDRNAAGLFLFRNDALQIDVKQAVFKLRGAHLDMFGQLEAAFEGAPGNALVQIALLGGVFAFADDRQYAIAHLHVQIILAEAGNSNRDPVVGLCLLYTSPSPRD